MMKCIQIECKPKQPYNKFIWTLDCTILNKNTKKIYI